MAGRKISELTAADALAGTETFPVVQAGSTVKATVNQVSDFIGRVTSAAGTANQVLVNGGTAAATGAITLSLPQSIATTSTPTFAALTLTATANTTPVSSTGYSLTGSATNSLVSLTGTLNTTGHVDVFKLAITNTASGANSRFLNLYGGASGDTSVFSVAADGSARATNYRGSGGIILITQDGDDARINTESGVIKFTNGGSTTWWRMNSSGLIAGADNTYDIGASGATRPRTLYVGTSVVNVGYDQFSEMTAPSGVANTARLYAEDNGAGKTRLVVIFGSGAAQVIATEP